MAQAPAMPLRGRTVRPGGGRRRSRWRGGVQAALGDAGEAVVSGRTDVAELAPGQPHAEGDAGGKGTGVARQRGEDAGGEHVAGAGGVADQAAGERPAGEAATGLGAE